MSSLMNLVEQTILKTKLKLILKSYCKSIEILFFKKQLIILNLLMKMIQTLNRD